MAGAVLAASMPLGPLRAACVRPAPKSRFVSSGPLRTKIKSKINGESVTVRPGGVPFAGGSDLLYAIV
jgi:hypothetical protein